MSGGDDDLIRDIVRQAAHALGADNLPEERLLEIEERVRQYWGGDRIYISRNAQDNERRNQAILRDWRNGERVSLLVRRYKLSRVRIWQIIKSVEDVKSLP